MPTPQSATQNAGFENAAIRVANGRVVFAEQKAFEQARTDLEQKSHLREGGQATDAWEKQINFHSLRTAAAQEEKNLEQLQSEHKLSPAHDLMEDFGFPDYYAALINDAGEYQVGTKIYWFHEGFKYEANSEKELASIKKNTSLAKTKYKAGSQILRKTLLPGNGSTGTTANRTVQSNNPYAYDKYTFLFDYQNDTGSKRRTILATSVYSEDYGTDYGALTHYWYTTIYLFIKYEYYSLGSRKWYPAGESFDWRVSYNFAGTPTIPDLYNSTPVSQQNLSTQGTFTNGQKTIQMGSQPMSSQDYGDPQRHSIYDITWDFEITGGIETGPHFTFPNGAYNIGQMLANPGPVIW